MGENTTFPGEEGQRLTAGTQGPEPSEEGESLWGPRNDRKKAAPPLAPAPLSEPLPQLLSCLGFTDTLGYGPREEGDPISQTRTYKALLLRYHPGRGHWWVRTGPRSL